MGQKVYSLRTDYQSTIDALVPLSLTGAFFCTAVEAVPIRISQRTRDVAIEAMDFSDPIPPHVFHLDVPFRFAISTPGFHSLIQLGANPAMLEQLLMEMFVPDTTQVLGFAG